MSEATDAIAADQSQETTEATVRWRTIKERRGKVVSAKMAKTVVVMVERRIKHRRYKKFVTIRERYAAHDLLGCTEGDIVLIRETRPLSKTKRWRVARKLGHQE
ncbi:MAG: 30S ribosomal protein S17 [Myxococcota bacterium]